MPFALLIVGLLLIVTGVNDTHKQFGQLLVGDFTGKNNFVYWALAFGSLGAIGYNETLRPFARAFMVLIFLALIVRNGGFFDKFGAALNTQASATNTKTEISIIPGDALKKLNAGVEKLTDVAKLAAVFV